MPNHMWSCIKISVSTSIVIENVISVSSIYTSKTYSKARAIPKAILTREFHIKGLL